MRAFWTGSGGALLGGQVPAKQRISFRSFLKSGNLPADLFKGASKQIVHAAAIVGAQNCDQDPDTAYQVNAQGVVRLLEAAATTRVRRFVYISTAHIFAPNLDPITETSRIGPLNYYADTKFVGEELGAKVAGELGIEFCSMRVFSVVGKSTNPASLAGLISRLCQGSEERLRFASDIRDFQTPHQYFDLITSLLALPTLPPSVNLGTGLGLSIADVAILIARNQGLHLDTSRFDFAVSDNPRVVSNPQLLSRLLNRKIKGLKSEERWPVDRRED